MRRELLTREIIGCRVKVVSSRNTSTEGMEGQIIDETRHTLVIRTKEGKKKILGKANHTFELGSAVTSGAALAGRPEERIKRWLRTTQYT